MYTAPRTDLAAEAREIFCEKTADGVLPEGVSVTTSEQNGFPVERITVRNVAGSASLCKPIGSYVTVGLDALLRRETDGFQNACQLLSSLLRELLPLGREESVLVAGLGNEAITPDALGPLSAQFVMVTRHLKERMPDAFRPLRSVSVVRSGVLGTTGIESSDLVAAAVRIVRPACVIAVDALCARSFEKLCRTVQLSDSGIVPGSGVGNARLALNADTLGVPVIAVGVPTVVDAAALCAQTPSPDTAAGMIVTPRDIDARVRDAARLIGYSIDLALHPALTPGDVDMFLS